MSSLRVRSGGHAALITLAVGLGAVVAAQQAQVPVFRAGTTSVALDVIVTDKSDRPVTDLRKDEFVVMAEGCPQMCSWWRWDKWRRPEA